MYTWESWWSSLVQLCDNTENVSLHGFQAVDIYLLSADATHDDTQE